MMVPLVQPDADYLAFAMRDIDKQEILATRASDYLHEFADDCVRYGNGWCYKNAAGVPIAMGGVCEWWPGVGTAWMVATDDITRHAVGLSRAAKQTLETHKNLHRIQAYSADFHVVSHAWLERLGFERGARLRGYGKGGEDFILFEKVR